MTCSRRKFLEGGLATALAVGLARPSFAAPTATPAEFSLVEWRRLAALLPDVTAGLAHETANLGHGAAPTPAVYTTAGYARSRLKLISANLREMHVDKPEAIQNVEAYADFWQTLTTKGSQPLDQAHRDELQAAWGTVFDNLHEQLGELKGALQEMGQDAKDPIVVKAIDALDRAVVAKDSPMAKLARLPAPLSKEEGAALIASVPAFMDLRLAIGAALAALNGFIPASYP